jgi:hypothetical protein
MCGFETLVFKCGHRIQAKTQVLYGVYGTTKEYLFGDKEVAIADICEACKKPNPKS